MSELKLSTSALANAVEAVEQIIHDLRDRSGLGNEWDEIDDDTQREIRKTWRDLVLREFGYGPADEDKAEPLGSQFDGAKSMGPPR